ncbi:MAG TPA: winged helix DNA-binding domain-containing protein [Acidimicrobiales bacterium]|nr:winged helix DNA-binding domain-containing protein [Acidimicrobiales bacterium]
MTADVLTRRALNRATLARQLLLERTALPALDAVEHLVGLQAQVPLNPYHALWSRLDGFRPDDLSQAMLDRRAVRIVVMRATIHLVTAVDCLVLRSLAQPVLDAELTRHRDHGPPLRGVDLDPVLDFARQVLAEQPLSNTELRAALAERFPELDAAALAYACRCKLGLVQAPPRGVWGRSGQVKVTTVESWLGRPLASDPPIDEVIMRYFAAFGPAAVADVATWSRLTGLREVVDRLRPRLRPFRDERGRELFDVQDAPRPDPDTPAPPRFLPEYDNVLLSHDDRSRFFPPDDRVRARLFGADRRVSGSVLHDGFGCGTWRLEHDRDGGAAAIVVDHAVRLNQRARSAVATEGRRLMRLLAPDAGGHDVRFVAR